VTRLATKEEAMNMRSLVPSVWERRGVDPFRHLQREIDHLFEDFVAPARWPLAAGNGKSFISLKLDVAETDSNVEITTELPGVDEKDIEVTVADGTLVIKGEKKAEKEEKKKDYHIVERSYGAFERSIALPAGTETDKITAKFDKGVLRIVFPKPAEPATKAKKIAIGG
jgi:HSP20 family protein